jgi:cell wall-associated NlpC family hydrolase
MIARTPALLKAAGTLVLVMAGFLATLPAVTAPGRAFEEAEGVKKVRRKREGVGSGDGVAFASLPPGARLTPAEIAVATARAQIGKPYRWGGVGPSSFDCSGLTRYAWAAAGVSLPHGSAAQFSSFRRVPPGRMRPGDVVYRPGHVGLYIGDGKMIHSPHSGERVRVSPIGYHIGAVRPAA